MSVKPVAWTPGPWTLKHIQGSNFAVQEFSIRAGAYPIFNKDISAINGASVYCSPADAALICAAPELAEALQKLVDWDKGTDDAVAALTNLAFLVADAKKLLARITPK